MLERLLYRGPSWTELHEVYPKRQLCIIRDYQVSRLPRQGFVGAFLDIAAQFGLAISVIFYVLPWIGLESGHRSRCGEFDLPMSLLTLWWGNH
jgi:hypothetical protein